MSDLAKGIIALLDKEKSKKKGDERLLGISPLSDPETPVIVGQVIPTGLPNLDRLLCYSSKGEWGLPVGKIVSVKAMPSVGKTSFLLRVAAETIKRGGAGHLIESEHAFDLNYAEKICPGIKENFVISQPDTLEEAFDEVHAAIEICLKVRKEVGFDVPYLIIMDSFSGFTTEAEYKEDFIGKGGGLAEHARIASKACRKITGKLDKARALLLLSHQVKYKVGVYYGNPETNLGGEAFNYHDSISIGLRRGQRILKKQGRKDVVSGHYGKFVTLKNKLAPPFREARFKIVNGVGFIIPFSLFDFLLSSGKIAQKGAWCSFIDKPWKFQGEKQFVRFLKTNKEARKYIKKLIKP